MIRLQAEATLSTSSLNAVGKCADAGAAGRIAAARNVLRTLIFYDLFDCPVRLDELPQRTIGGLSGEWLAAPGAMIESHPVLSRHVAVANGYVFLRNTPARFARWEAAETTRRQSIDRYEKWVRLLCRIPFVRLVAVTGSLTFRMSAGEPDCDLFVVAQRNRVWLVVALGRALFQRVLPWLGLIRYGDVCVNYVVDDLTALGHTQDLFESMQVAAMNPVVGRPVYDRFVREHRSLRRFFPQWQPPAPLFPRTSQSPPRLTRRLGERALGLLPLDWIDRRLHRHLSRRFAAVGIAEEEADPGPGHRPSGWVGQVFDLSEQVRRFTLREFKTHGNHKRELSARFEAALRSHPANAQVDLAGTAAEGTKPS